MAVGEATTPDDVASVVTIGALTTLSPIERLGALRRRLTLVAEFPGAGRPLLELSFIHFARWAIISELPAPDGRGEPWKLNWHYLLFESNYDGSEESYLTTFADVLPTRLTRLFGACVGFAETVERADGVIDAPAFRQFVGANKLEVLAFCPSKDRPSASAIRQAIEIERAERRSARLTGPALEQVQRQVEGMALGPNSRPPGAWDGVIAPWLRRRRRDYGVNPLTIVAPLKPRYLGPGSGKPKYDRARLAGLPSTHFARVAFIGTHVNDLGQPDPDVLPVPYVLFTCDHDGRRDDYLEMLRRRRPSPADALFGKCAGYPGSAYKQRFHEWVGRHSVEVSYYVAGYPPRTVEEIERLARVRAGIAQRLGGE